MPGSGCRLAPRAAMRGAMISCRLPARCTHQPVVCSARQAHSLAAPQQLLNGGVHVWWHRPGQAAEAAWSLVTDEDKLELATGSDARVAGQRLLGRAFLRSVLARYCGQTPLQLAFRRGQHGKPHLALPQEAAGLHFNLSHTSTLLGCAVTRGQTVGLDIESLQRPFRASPVRLAQHNFSPAETENLRGIACEEAQRRHFLRVWNLKEAYCKAQGLGIVTTMRHSTFTLSRPGKPACKHLAGGDLPFGTGTNLDPHKSTWRISMEPEDKRAAVVLVDVDEAHSAAVCTYASADNAGQHSTRTLSHFWLSKLNAEGVCTGPAVMQTCC